jgi:uncharacterized membrane protein YraQ (UPF0718 family)
VDALRRHRWPLVIGFAFAAFVAISFAAGYEPGRRVAKDFGAFFVRMLAVLPCVFILIGLFDTWVKREHVERHLGRESGPLAYLWAVLLAGTIVGGMHVALPVAHALYVKRAKLGVVLTYLTCAAVCRVPMTLFEASFLGGEFTAVRFAVSLPLVVVSSALIGAWLERRGYRLPDLDDTTAGAGSASR